MNTFLSHGSIKVTVSYLVVSMILNASQASKHLYLEKMIESSYFIPRQTHQINIKNGIFWKNKTTKFKNIPVLYMLDLLYSLDKTGSACI